MDDSQQLILTIKDSIRKLKAQRDTADAEIMRLQAMLDAYSSTLSKFEVVNNLTLRDTFATLIRGWLKEADRPLMSKELRHIYNTTTGRKRLDPHKFSSRLSTTSTSKDWYFYQTLRSKNRDVYFWLLNDWAPNGIILPKYHDMMKKRIAEIDSEDQ